jgi:hypothetical protein
MSEPRDIIGNDQPEHCDLPSGWMHCGQGCVWAVVMPSQAAAQALRKLGIDVEEAVNMSLYNQSRDGLERYILYLADWNENDIGKSPVRQVVVCPQWRTPEDHNLFAEIPHDALVLLHLPNGVVLAQRDNERVLLASEKEEVPLSDIRAWSPVEGTDQ